jgi:transposase-like protein
MNHGQQARIARGAHIVSVGGQIERIDNTTYAVKSQSNPNHSYDVISTERGMACSCPDYKYRMACCKHIHAVELSIRMREAVQETVSTTIKTVDITRCKFCDSTHIIRKGIKKAKKGDMQQFGCKDCGKRFTLNLGFEKKRATPEQITTAVDLLFGGLSSRKVASTLAMTGLKTTHITVQNWGKEYATLMETFVDKVRPQVGEAWRTDELYLKIKGNRRYLFAMLDTETRFWIAKMVAEHKGNDDVTPMFKEARTIAGKVPTTTISDGAANFHHAWKDQYRAKNFLHKETEHINDVAFDGIHHNNQMESFNGNTIRHREKVCRGLKREDSAIISGLRLYHNFVRPHQGLPDHITPAEAAGIHVEGDNKWKTLIQAAAKSAA